SLAAALFRVKMKVAEGKTLGNSLKEEGFPVFFCLMIQSGEITGTLDLALAKYSENMRKDKTPKKFW
ncbi:MAG: type II secretion system F family protein, partial [Candidatus Magasanikbacteria bacterium]|nr:type II secretion system F family protein [Candidatus Magasanikbacteria bacterium]